MCIRDRVAREIDPDAVRGEATTLYIQIVGEQLPVIQRRYRCLLYTSDAADDLLCVDLGGRRIIKKKTTYKCISFR